MIINFVHEKEFQMWDIRSEQMEHLGHSEHFYKIISVTKFFFHQMNSVKWNFSSQMKTDFPLFSYKFFSLVFQVRLNYPDKLFEKQCKWFIVRAICTWCGNRLSFIFCYQRYFSGNIPFNLDPYIMWQLIRLTPWKYDVARYASKECLTFSSKKSLHNLCDIELE